MISIEIRKKQSIEPFVFASKMECTSRKDEKSNESRSVEGGPLMKERFLTTTILATARLSYDF